MSRTKHMTVVDRNAYGSWYRHRSPRRARARAPVSLTPQSNDYHSTPHAIKAQGNHWEGTISATGGDARRRRDIARRTAKAIGRRRDRRIRNRTIEQD